MGAIRISTSVNQKIRPVVILRRPHFIFIFGICQCVWLFTD
jgi:hypothetical protein